MRKDVAVAIQKKLQNHPDNYVGSHQHSNQKATDKPQPKPTFRHFPDPDLTPMADYRQRFIRPIKKCYPQRKIATRALFNGRMRNAHFSTSGRLSRQNAPPASGAGVGLAPRVAKRTGGEESGAAETGMQTRSGTINRPRSLQKRMSRPRLSIQEGSDGDGLSLA